MAHALRKVWLEPEPAEDARPLHPRPRRTPPRTRPAWQAQVGAFMLIGFVVALLVTYVHCFARIAECEFQRRKLQQQQAKLSRECILLNLEIDRLASQGCVNQLVQAHALELPATNRIHYVRVAQAPAASLMASAAPTRSWWSRSQGHLANAFGQAFQRLSYAPANAAVTR
jgi:hypothetical protein